ncbi:transcriptional regulator [Pokkaliibacter sp. CJK22405]|uniref:helix-turn-helix transcriptional regulator n=1 Tax=Pokkaliibacter sp. CJK22405 TaxID=3384615 RepID=UPI003984CF39
MSQMLLQRYGALTEMLAGLFPGLVEVALHDLKTLQLIAIAGAFSPRTLGESSAVSMDGLRDSSSAVIGPYRKTLAGGENVSATTTLLYDDDGQLIGMLCINMRTQAIHGALEVLQRLSGSAASYEDQKTTALPVEQPVEALMAHDWQEQINQIINEHLAKWQMPLVAIKKPQRLMLLDAMEGAGIFQVRGAGEFVAQTLGLSRSGFYSLLREIRHTTPSPSTYQEGHA